MEEGRFTLNVGDTHPWASWSPAPEVALLLTVVFLGTVPFCSRRLGEYVTEDARVELQ